MTADWSGGAGGGEAGGVASHREGKLMCAGNEGNTTRPMGRVDQDPFWKRVPHSPKKYDGLGGSRERQRESEWGRGLLTSVVFPILSFQHSFICLLIYFLHLAVKFTLCFPYFTAHFRFI